MAPVRLARPAALALWLLLAQAWPELTWAFETFGLRSGMTVEQVRAAAPAGTTLRQSGDFGFIEKNGEAVATVTFCKGRLIALSRTIDAQSDWFDLADRMIKQYGPPKVTSTSDPWAGPKANASKGLELSWRSGRTKYALTSYPPAQPGPGPGKGSKALASLSVADLGPENSCVPKREAVRPQPRKASSVRRAPREARVMHVAHVTHVTRVTHDTRVKRVKSQLPPIGGAKLKLTPPEAQPAGPASRATNAARDAPVRIDPASVRGRILRFFGYPSSRFYSAHEIAEER
jgi:hypothetical protein